MTPIVLRQLTKRFGQTTAVNQIDLRIEAGQLFFLLGPSGCGKTTLLRMIAGFTDPTEGQILFGDKDVTHLPANKRNCGMVFQNYALWPHMTVAQNVAFGLDVRKVTSEEKTRRVNQALKTVQMDPYADRKPNQLSGGQQQRVALARALVIEPTVLLLDEPLSNLDAKLRLDMRGQIKDICNQTGITAVYVTHDQKEALSMADGVAVLKFGNVIQVGKPHELYNRPANRFVADFLGETNFVPAEIVGREGQRIILESEFGRLVSTVSCEDLPETGNVTCSIRPEVIRVIYPDTAGPAPVENVFDAQCSDSTYLGEMAQHQITLTDSQTLKVFELNPKHVEGQTGQVKLHFDPSDVVILKD